MSYIKKLFNKLNKRQKISTFLLFLSMIFSSLLELFAVASISPIVNVIQARNLSDIEFAKIINNNIFSKIIAQIFKIPLVVSSANSIILTMIIFVICLYLLKSFYSVIRGHFARKYSASLSRSFSYKLIEANLNMPYSYFVKTNSSVIIRKCTSDVGIFCHAINAVLSTITSVLTAIGLYVYLMLQSWMITLIFSFFMVFGSFISVFLLKNIARNVGHKMQLFDSKNIDILHKSIYGIKETKIADTSNYFLNDYYQNAKSATKLSLKYSFFSGLPSVILSNLGIVIVLITTALLVIFLDSKESAFIVTLLTSFVLAIVRLLPCINSISSNAVSFSYFKPSVNTILRDLNEADKIKEENDKITKIYGKRSLNFKHMITIKKLDFSYIPNKTILKNVNLKIIKGEYVAFSGKSGAGKTTLIDNLLGLLTPQKGDIFCDDRSIYENIKSWHKKISYVPQNIFLLDDSIKANVCFGLQLKKIKDKDVWDALEKAQLKDFVNELPKKLNTIIGEGGIRLSGGQRQRIGIARAFFRNTPIMVLDEATSSLDYQTEDNILLNIRKVKGDKTVIIITHRLNTISHCDKIFTIENAKCKQIK